MLSLYQIRANGSSLPFINVLRNSVPPNSFSKKKKKKIRCKMLTGMKAIGKDTVSHYGHFLLSLNFSPTNTEDRCLKFHAILVFDKLGEYMDPVLVL